MIVENPLFAFSICHFFFLFVLQEWVATFEKPKGNPSAFLKPATTVLSPYLKVSYEQEEPYCLLFQLLLLELNLKILKNLTETYTHAIL